MKRIHVESGIDRIDLMDKALAGKRLAVMTSGGAVNGDLIPTVDVLTARYRVVKLFNTIYGIRGDFRYGERIPEYVDEPTGLTAYSVFSSERTAPDAAMLSDVDAVVFDIREAGTRFFEYVHCLADLMRACSACGKEVVVLDRVAPIGGAIVEGTVCPPTMHTIVGDYELPSRIALTIGEFARYVNGEFGLNCPLTVIPLEGWRRDLYYDETDVPWLLPSPSLNCTDANILYAGYCLFEGVKNLSEGRGTSIPFQLTGAPWLNADALCRELNARHLPGMRFAKVFFRPTSSTYAMEVCNGVQSIIDDRQAARPFLTALTMLEIIRELHPDTLVYSDCSAGHGVKEKESSPVFTRYLDKIMASTDFTDGALTAAQIDEKYAPERARYAARKQKYHLY